MIDNSFGFVFNSKNDKFLNCDGLMALASQRIWGEGIFENSSVAIVHIVRACFDFGIRILSL